MPEDKRVTVSELNVALDRQRDEIIDRLLEHVGKQREELLERIERTETTLLKEFRKRAISFESRFKANEALVVGFSERLTALEERVSDLERGRD